MPSYSKVVAHFTLKEDTPPPVSIVLKLMVADTNWAKLDQTDLQHPSFVKRFFHTESWYTFFGDFTHVDRQCRKRFVDELTLDAVSIIVASDFLVHRFWEWIQEYVDRTKPYEVSCIPLSVPMYDAPATYTFLETHVESEIKNRLHTWLCADCGTHSPSLFGPCCVCDSPRLMLTSIAKKLMGDNYMSAFYTDDRRKNPRRREERRRRG